MEDIIVSRGHRYNRTTGRWLGPVDEEQPVVVEAGYEVVAATAPSVDGMDMKALREIAKVNDVAGYSTMKKKELITTLVAAGLVSEAEDASDTAE